MPNTLHVTMQVVRVSQADYEADAKVQELRKLMRSLQLQDEDVALAIAIAESLRDAALRDAEMADLEQVGKVVFDLFCLL